MNRVIWLPANEAKCIASACRGGPCARRDVSSSGRDLNDFGARGDDGRRMHDLAIPRADDDRTLDRGVLVGQAHLLHAFDGTRGGATAIAAAAGVREAGAERQQGGGERAGEGGGEEARGHFGILLTEMDVGRRCRHERVRARWRLLKSRT